MIMKQQIGSFSLPIQPATLSSLRSRLQKGIEVAVFSVVLLFLSTSVSHAQLTKADILGTVTDSTGAVVPNATVVLTNIGTNENRTTQTNGSGDYNFTFLPVAHYSISVKATGFSASITPSLRAS